MSWYFEDLVIGAVIDLGAHTFQHEECVDFASKYDAQPFHLTDEAAARTMYGKMTASGWHTTAIWLRHMVDARNRDVALMRFRGERPARYGPSPGFEKLRWIKPVYMGDTIRFSTCVIEKRDWPSRPDVGLVHYQNDGIDENGDAVFSIISKIFVERRQPLKP